MTEKSKQCRQEKKLCLFGFVLQLTLLLKHHIHPPEICSGFTRLNNLHRFAIGIGHFIVYHFVRMSPANQVNIS